jgi:hypothetical protein
MARRMSPRHRALFLIRTQVFMFPANFISQSRWRCRASARAFVGRRFGSSRRG